MCADVTRLQLNVGERERDEIVVEERFLLQSMMNAMKSYSAEESAETLILSRNDVGEPVL